LLLKIDTEGYEDKVLKGAEKLFKNRKIENVVCETKPLNDIDYKVDFINGMIAKGYFVYAYNEYYSHEAGGWTKKVKTDFDKKQLIPLSKVTRQEWIPSEDLWYSLTERNKKD